MSRFLPRLSMSFYAGRLSITTCGIYSHCKELRLLPLDVFEPPSSPDTTPVIAHSVELHVEDCVYTLSAPISFFAVKRMIPAASTNGTVPWNSCQRRYHGDCSRFPKPVQRKPMKKMRNGSTTMGEIPASSAVHEAFSRRLAIFYAFFWLLSAPPGHIARLRRPLHYQSTSSPLIPATRGRFTDSGKLLGSSQAPGFCCQSYVGGSSPPAYYMTDIKV